MTQSNRVSFLSLILLLCSFYASAQTISGTIADTTNKKDVSNVVIALLKPVDSTLFKFVRSDKDGKFELKNIIPGKYILMITHPIYADLLDDITVPADGLNLKSVSIIPKSKLLQELIVKSTAAMRIKDDTTIYTADSFKVSANANVEELLKKLPGIQVDKDGKIKAMGETVEKVLVDGEEFFGDDPGMAIKNLRADAVKEVQVYNKKSDQAEFTGIDDGKTKKTINLKLKVDRKHGYFGKIDLSGGTKKNIDNRYNNNILLNSFKGKRKIAGYFLNGNTGQDGLGWNDQEKFGGGDENFSLSADDDGNVNFNWTGGSTDDEPYVDTQNGLFKNNNLGLQYTNKWNDKRSLSLSPKYNYQDYTNTIKSFTQTQVKDTLLNNNAMENIHVNKKTFKLNAVYDIKIDSFNILKITAKTSIYNTQSQSYRTSRNTSGQDSLNNTSDNQTTTDTDKQLFDAAVLYKHKFKKLRRTFSVNVDWYTLNTTGTTFLKSDNEIYQHGIVTTSEKYDRQKDYNKKTQLIVTKMIYTEPLSKTFSLEVNYELSLNSGKNNQTTHSYSPISNKYDEMVDSLTNLFDQKITTSKPGFKISYNSKKLKYSFGSGIGITRFDLMDRTFNKDYVRNYTNFFPSANLNYDYKSGHSLRIGYNGNTRQPQINQLQLLRNNDDYFNQYLGNPLLKPSFSNNLYLNHSSYDFIKESSIYEGLSFTQTSNAITDSRTINATTGKTISEPMNTNGNFSFYFYSGIDFKIKKLDLHIGGGPRANYSHSTEIINGENNVSKNLSTSISIYLSKSKDKKYDINFSNTFTYNSNSTQQFNRVIKYNTNELTFDGTVYIHKVWAIKSDISYYLRQKTVQFQDNLSNQLWNARLQRTFKKNEFTAYFAIKDILNQNTNISRSFYSNTLSSITNERLRQYWLVGFTWDFKNKTSAAAK